MLINHPDDYFFVLLVREVFGLAVGFCFPLPGLAPSGSATGWSSSSMPCWSGRSPKILSKFGKPYFRTIGPDTTGLPSRWSALSSNLARLFRGRWHVQ